MSGFDKEFREIFEVIRSKDRILLTTHERPDADGVGCELAMKFALDNLGKETRIVNESDFPDIYKFLPGCDRIHIYPDGFDDRFDLVISIDAGSRTRLGPMAGHLPAGAPLINIDHHVSNELFGDHNLVDPHISSSGELVFHFLKANNIPLDLNIAICLYASIITDTGRFSHANTSPRVLRVAAELVEMGVKPEVMTRRIYGSKSIPVMQLQALALGTLSFSDDGRIAWMQVSNDMYEKTNTSQLDTQDFVEIPKGIAGVKVAFLLREGDTPDSSRVSMRSNNSVDVNQIAQQFGGGGHPQASGCSIDEPMDTARESLLAAVNKALNGTA